MNLYFYYTCEIRISISEWLGSNNDKIRIMAKKMLEKYDKYWSVVNELMAVATVLDPRYKMKLVEYYFPMLYGVDCEHRIGSVRNYCYDLVKEYQLKSKSYGHVC